MSEDLATLQSVTLDERLVCDLELLLDGSFHPLEGFLNEADYISVVDKMRLTSGALWPIPIVLPIDPQTKARVTSQPKIVLRDPTNLPLAILHVESIYRPDLPREWLGVFGTVDDNHPSVGNLAPDVHYIGGKVERLHSVVHYDYRDLRLSPATVKQFFADHGWTTVVGFQTRNPMHRSHYELSKFALREAGADAHLLLHPVVGVTQDCDVPYQTRLRCYQELLHHYEPGTVKLALLPLAMRMAGPREAVWHALIRKNYGCTHFVIGRDHAGPSYRTKQGASFYTPYQAQDLLLAHADEIGIKVIASPEIVYVKELDAYVNERDLTPAMTPVRLSGTEQRRYLTEGTDIPAWFSFPGVLAELRRDYRPLHLRGLCVYFVGLSCSGKSTLANALKVRLEELDRNRRVTLLDGDVVRQFLSKGLGFSKEDRSTNVKRIGYVASEIVHHNGICLCANIAPYDADRVANRQLIQQYGSYVEVYVQTPVSVCESRDIKGLYKMARQGIVKNFTGVDDPFEPPTRADLVVDHDTTIDATVDKILAHLKSKGLVG